MDHYRGLKTISHGGSWYGYRAQFLRFPDQGYSFICLANAATMKPDWLAKKTADLYLKEFFTDRPLPENVAGMQVTAPAPQACLDGIAGCYCAEGGELGCLEIRTTDGEIWVEALGDRQEMCFLEPCRIISADGSRDIDLTFEISPEGEIRSVTANLHAGALLEVLKPIRPEPRGGESLLPFCGEFHNNEVRATHQVSVQAGCLSLKIASQPTIKLRWLGDDWFDAGLFQLRYHREETGRMAGYALHTGRARRMTFHRIPQSPGAPEPSGLASGPSSG